MPVEMSLVPLNTQQTCDDEDAVQEQEDLDDSFAHMLYQQDSGIHYLVLAVREFGSDPQKPELLIKTYAIAQMDQIYDRRVGD